jgi:hypothetical protein
MFAWLKGMVARQSGSQHSTGGKPLSPAAKKWLYGNSQGEYSQAVKDFIDGKTNVLTSKDVDPEGWQRYSTYESAMQLKAQGDTARAQEVLFAQCSVPNIFKGHYRELFKLWRGYNKIDLRAGQFSNVIDRVQLMIRFDDEMIEEMLKHWSAVHNRNLPKNYFDKDRNLKVTDAKALLAAAQSLGDAALIERAKNVQKRFA